MMKQFLSSRFYLPLSVLAVAVAVFGMGAMFGLGVVKPSAPANKAGPQAEVKFTTEPKVVQKTEPVVAPTAQADIKTANSTLSPIYPTDPNAPPNGANPPAQDKAVAAAAPTNGTTANPAQEQAAVPTAPASGIPAPKAEEAPTNKTVAAPQALQGIAADATKEKEKPAGAVRHEEVASAPAPKRDEVASAPKKVTEAAVTRANKCDVQACASAYKSFRESDCTDQPFEGPRQICTGAPASVAPAAKATVASAPRGERQSEADRDSGSAQTEVVVERRTEVIDADDDDDMPARPPHRRHPSFFPFSIFPRW